jgi:predicted nucleic acid-binding protein
VVVVDTSAVVAALVARPRAPDLDARLKADGELHAPHLIDVELLHALQRLLGAGALTGERAADARADFADLSVVRYPHVALADRAWELRDNLTPYDAMFVALAELLDVPLITCDARLERAPGHGAQVDVYG